MQIRQNNIYEFLFPYEGHEICIPVRGNSKDEASQKLLDFFKQWGMEISMEMPKIEAKPVNTAKPDQSENTYTPVLVPPEVSQARMETLYGDLLSISPKLNGKVMSEAIKEITNLECIPENFIQINKLLEEAITEKINGKKKK